MKIERAWWSGDRGNSYFNWSLAKHGSVNELGGEPIIDVYSIRKKST